MKKKFSFVLLFFIIFSLFSNSLAYTENEENQEKIENTSEINYQENNENINEKSFILEQNKKEQKEKAKEILQKNLEKQAQAKKIVEILKKKQAQKRYLEYLERKKYSRKIKINLLKKFYNDKILELLDKIAERIVENNYDRLGILKKKVELIDNAMHSGKYRISLKTRKKVSLLFKLIMKHITDIEIKIQKEKLEETRKKEENIIVPEQKEALELEKFYNAINKDKKETSNNSGEENFGNTENNNSQSGESNQSSGEENSGNVQNNNNLENNNSSSGENTEENSDSDEQELMNLLNG